ncbi:epimerase [Candidatus Ornithobacterium hominis]|uniref:epimerase n=2 Tax=Flavobacteriales TaxID=200644 RepID=UPI0021A9F2C7|nr:epimerase [Candidatus Ornithobacterium hominis]
MGYNSIAIQFSDYEIFQEYKSWKAIADLDTIIITVPFSKRASTNLLKNRFENISLFIDNFDKQLFLMSSVGIYPQIKMEIAENTLSEEYLNPSILFVEQLMRNKFVQVNILRLGGLMGGDRIFSNYETSTPNQIVNHVHYKDICLVIEKMIFQNSNAKTYNVVAPLHPTKQEIINYQKGIEDASEIQKYGRKILTDLLISDLDYQYINPNPIIYK